MQKMVGTGYISICSPDCPSHPANASQMGWATWAVWAAIKKYSQNVLIYVKTVKYSLFTTDIIMKITNYLTYFWEPQ